MVIYRSILLIYLSLYCNIDLYGMILIWFDRLEKDDHIEIYILLEKLEFEPFGKVLEDVEGF